MTVRDHAGRRRYIVFRFANGAQARRDVADAAIRAGLAGYEPRLTRFDGTVGIVRVPHDKAGAARAALVAHADLEPVGTSGTVKAAVKRFAPNLSRARAGGARRGKNRHGRADRALYTPSDSRRESRPR